MSNKRKTLRETVRIVVTSNEGYPIDITKGPLIKALEEVKDDDKIFKIHESTEILEGFGIDPRDNRMTYHKCLLISRNREENDNEYSMRMSIEAIKEKKVAKEEYNEYLRLKAKYE